MMQKNISCPDRRTEAFFFVDGKRYAVSPEGRQKALQAIEKAGFSERDALAYLNLLDRDYQMQRMKTNEVPA